jgi:hypothetical protein
MRGRFPRGHREGVDLAGGIDAFGAGEQAFDGDDLDLRIILYRRPSKNRITTIRRMIPIRPCDR